MLWITFYSYSAQLAWQNAQSALSNKFQPCQWRKLYNGDKFVMTSSLRSRQARNVQLYSNLRINTDESKGFSRRLIKTGMELGHMTELEMSIQRGSQDLHCKGLGFANKATKFSLSRWYPWPGKLVCGRDHIGHNAAGTERALEVIYLWI